MNKQNYEIVFVVCPECGAYMVMRRLLINYYTTEVKYLCYCGHSIKLIEHNLNLKYRKGK